MLGDEVPAEGVIVMQVLDIGRNWRPVILLTNPELQALTVRDCVKGLQYEGRSMPSGVATGKEQGCDLRKH